MKNLKEKSKKKFQDNIKCAFCGKNQVELLKNGIPIVLVFWENCKKAKKDNWICLECCKKCENFKECEAF